VDVVLPTFNAPLWVNQTIIFLLMLGLPVAVVLAWAFEITPEGIQKTEASNPGEATNLRKRDYFVGAALLGLIAVVVVQQFVILNRPVLDESIASEENAAESLSRVEELEGDTAGIPNSTIEKSVAVLPFADLSADGDQEFFADGITEEILNTLVRVPQLKVAARTSSFQFKGDNRNIIDIGTQLGVATVLEGSVRKSGERVRITAQLINVADGFHLWSQSYDESIADLFELQNRIARQIAGAMSIQLDSLVIQGTGGATNPAAFDALVRGRHAFAERHLPGQRREGIEQFALATVIDPSYAVAWAHYAYSMSISGSDTIGLDETARLKLIRTAVDQALNFAPDNPLALAVRGKLQVQNFDFEAGLETLSSLTTKYPSFVEGQYSFAQALGEMGRIDEALITLRRVLALDPLNLTRKRVYAEQLMYSGRFEESFRVMNDVVSLSGNADELMPLFSFQLIANRNGNWRSIAEQQGRFLESRVGAGMLEKGYADYLSKLSAFLESGDPSALHADLGRLHWMDPSERGFVLYFLWTDEHIDMVISALLEAIAEGNLLNTAPDWFLQPAFNLPDSVRNNPGYAAVWESPQMKRFARVRIANGALQGIPQVVIDELRAQ
jgi:TolB-like protein